MEKSVLLISPSSNRLYVPSAPLGLSLIAGYLPPDVDVQGLDLNVLKWIHGLDDQGIYETIDHYLEKRLIYGIKPHIIGVTVYQETLEEAIRIAKLARKYHIYTVAGGIYPTLFPEDISGDFDFLVRGEGQMPFRRLVQQIHGEGKPFSTGFFKDIPGLAYWEKGKGWVHGAAEPDTRRKIRTYPRRDIFEELNGGFHYYSARVTSSSGCPYGCSFCTNSQFSRREWIPKETDSVMAEVEAVLKDPFISEICFSDDQFLGFEPCHYERAYELLRRLERITQRRNLRVNLQVRADHFLKALDYKPELGERIQAISRNFMDRNWEASRLIHGRAVRGFSLDIGVESNLDERLKGFSKGLKAEDNIQAIRKAREWDIDLGLYMITFTPEIGLEQLWKEFDIYLREYIDTDDFSRAALINFFQELVPYKGTRVYDQLKEEGNLIERGSFTGFRFQDPGTAVFYVLFLYHLETGILEQYVDRDSMVAKITKLFKVSNSLRRHPSLADICSQVVCELKDRNEILYLGKKIMNLIEA